LSKESSNEESEQAFMLQVLEGVGLGDDVTELAEHTVLGLLMFLFDLFSR
jgi:hypothetical protein